MIPSQRKQINAHQKYVERQRQHLHTATTKKQTLRYVNVCLMYVAFSENSVI